MTDTSGSVAFLAADVPANWAAEPALYTDLNASATAGDGATVYPIFDPAETNSVQGVSIDGGHGAEMPVAWLYQLQDGTLGPASNATPANPIVARIAFWTDDDTCKVNINTAGAAAPWNEPRANSADDIAWAASQPALGEFAAYPGHPATTSLRVVLGGTATNAPMPAQLQQWLDLTPRYAAGGSLFGTQPTTAGQSVPVKTGRLYASLDELLFSDALTSAGPARGQSARHRVAHRRAAAQRRPLRAHRAQHRAGDHAARRAARRALARRRRHVLRGGRRLTATDRAIMSAATLGTRDYFFQRRQCALGAR
ncbi:MAG: hypothetical protein WDO13_00085 [Verrucomicrobiota bacterium]